MLWVISSLSSVEFSLVESKFLLVSIALEPLSLTVIVSSIFVQRVFIIS